MTYYESYIACGSIEKAKEKAIEDVKVAIFLGNNPDRIKAIEDALNEAVRLMEARQMAQMATEDEQHNILYEPTYNPEDGSM